MQSLWYTALSICVSGSRYTSSVECNYLYLPLIHTVQFQKLLKSLRKCGNCKSCSWERIPVSQTTNMFSSEVHFDMIFTKYRPFCSSLNMFNAHGHSMDVRPFGRGAGAGLEETMAISCLSQALALPGNVDIVFVRHSPYDYANALGFLFYCGSTHKDLCDQFTCLGLRLYHMSNRVIAQVTANM